MHMTLLSNLIIYIVSVCSYKKMSRFNAIWCITGMSNNITFFNLTNIHVIRKSMRIPIFPSGTNYTVAHSVWISIFNEKAIFFSNCLLK